MTVFKGCQGHSEAAQAVWPTELVFKTAVVKHGRVPTSIDLQRMLSKQGRKQETVHRSNAKTVVLGGP